MRTRRFQTEQFGFIRLAAFLGIYLLGIISFSTAQETGGGDYSGGQTGGGGGSEGGSIQGSQVSDNYVIQARDIIKFKIFGEPHLETQVRVSADGSISLPWIGDIPVKGKTVLDARRAVYELYDRDYFVNPQVELLVLQYAESRVQVLGQVMRQGDVVIPPDETLTLLQAISRCNGFTRLANTKKVKLQREGADGKIKEYIIDTRKISAREWPLEKGDVIIVPEGVL